MLAGSMGDTLFNMMRALLLLEDALEFPAGRSLSLRDLPPGATRGTPCAVGFGREAMS